MFDSKGRKIHYLRLSVTDLCNLRCRYCMPDGVPKLAHEDILTYEEFLRLAALFAQCGIDTVRITGGEPLVRRGVEQLTAGLKAIPGIRRVALTTNGVLLPKMADDLKRAGLSRVNISLDTLDPEQFKYITRRGELQQTLDGIDAATIETRYLRVGDGPATPCKLVLSRNDGPTLEAVLNDTPLPDNASENVQRNLAFFQSLMDEDGFDPRALWRGIEKLFIISAEVGAADNAQLIFESLNSKGKPLTTADLVRNYLLIAEGRKEQERLYEEYWKPIELMFGDDPGSEKLNAGIRMWLTIRFVKERIRDKSQTYSVFKAYIEDEYDGPLEDLLVELRNFCLMWSENYKSHDVMTGSKEFRSWDWAKGKRTTLVPPRASQGGF